MINNLKCKRCGHDWVSHKEEGLPNTCPSCKKWNWNVGTLDKEKHTSMRFGF